MPSLGRFFHIVFIVLRYRLDELVLTSIRHPVAAFLLRFCRLGTRAKAPRGVRLRLALEALGPVFVKFGQVLSTRRDIIPTDIADELAYLQDRVPPFPSKQAMAIIEKALGASPQELFLDFEVEPVASASIAQVHFAVLHSGQRVAVKVLRPGMRKIINKDVRLMRLMAAFIEWASPDGRRLRPKEVVDEFDKYLNDELDLIREASNCSQLRRNFSRDKNRANLLLVPEVYWDYCATNVFTMQRMSGIQVSKTQALTEAGVVLPLLARKGVEIFFSQVFGDGFFHADMHPGNIYVSVDEQTFGQYIALDFGIMGTLSEFDKNYLAQNFLAFFQRDYRRVAQLHIESGWVPPDTREEELEGAIRGVCEPYFDRPLSQISLAQVLMRLFQTSRRFNVEIQPQLVLLQKTLLNVEGMGRELDPELDLWDTAQPYLENWMRQRVGVAGLVDSLQKEAGQWSQILPQLPRLAYERLQRPTYGETISHELNRLARSQRRTNWLLGLLCLIVLILLLLLWWQR